MEYCDIVDETGARTGRTVARGTAVGPGEFYLVVHVWIRDETGAYLIQQRAERVDSAPGVWAATAGYVQAGEDSQAAAMREAREELGIGLSSRQLSRFGRAPWGDLLADLWLARVPRSSIDNAALGVDVSATRWVTRADLITLAARGEFFSYTYLNELPA
jgi:8-oxo-dGTP pyrophosphatase MutT (NUDIX family)